MFNRTKTPTHLDETLDILYAELMKTDPTSEEGREYYDFVSTQIAKLQKLKKETEPSLPVSPETLATIAANLLGIVLILNFERGAIVTSKAVGFVKKLI